MKDPSPPLRVALAIPHLGGGGAERSTLAIARGLISRDYTVDILIFYDSMVLRNEVPSAARVILLQPRKRVFLRHFQAIANQLGIYSSLRIRRRNISQAISIADYIDRARPDLLLAALAEPKIASLLAPIFTTYRPVVVPIMRNHIMNRNWRNRAIYRILFRKADHIIAVSIGVAESLSASIRVPMDRITCIYNPVVSNELSSLAENPPDHPWFSGLGPPIVLAAGRLSRVKDFPTLIRAFEIVSRKRPLRLVILGEGSWRGRLQHMVHSRGLEASVSLPGWQPNPFAYMKRASLFVLTSRYEGLSGVLIQALACGCPCISTNCPTGSSEILQDGRIGPLVPVGDFITLAGAIEQVLDNPPERDLLLERAASFNIDRSLSSYDSLLTRLTRAP